MYSRATALGFLALVGFALPMTSAPTFTLESTGAVRLHAAGHEARYGVVPYAVRGRPIVMVTLGAAAGTAAVQLMTMGDRPPEPGRYPIVSSWSELDSESVAFHASFMPGTVERPLGWYHGESGWVTITETRAGRITGTFEVRARGFTADDPLDEEQWVTLRGSFDAEADSSATIASGR